MIGVGAWAAINGSSYDQLTSSDVRNAAIAMVCLGCFVLLISLFGCLGALRENTCLLKTYFATVLVLLIAQIVVGILAYVYRNKVRDMVSDNWNRLYQNSTDRSLQDAVNQMQSSFQCCGLNNYTEWLNANLSIPSSCCRTPTTLPNCGGPSNVYGVGCISQVEAWIQHNLIVVGSVLVALVVVQVRPAPAARQSGRVARLTVRAPLQLLALISSCRLIMAYRTGDSYARMA